MLGRVGSKSLDLESPVVGGPPLKPRDYFPVSKNPATLLPYSKIPPPESLHSDSSLFLFLEAWFSTLVSGSDVERK